MASKLILAPLVQATQSLRDVLAQSKDEFIRDATIKRFEYTFELSWKMIKRHLDWMGISDTASLSRKDLFREAAKAGLLSAPERWFKYNQARNESSHTYNVQTAEDVYEEARNFLTDVEELVINLKQHHD